jgi:hypothetical protein
MEDDNERSLLTLRILLDELASYPIVRDNHLFQAAIIAACRAIQPRPVQIRDSTFRATAVSLQTDADGKGPGIGETAGQDRRSASPLRFLLPRTR